MHIENWRNKTKFPLKVHPNTHQKWVPDSIIPVSVRAQREKLEPLGLKWKISDTDNGRVGKPDGMVRQPWD